MEVDPFEQPIQGQPDELDDLKSVAGLSTLLVATIQDAKDRISQVEYIFCSQLYPNFQQNSKSVQKLCLEARKAAEDQWKETQNQLANQIEKLSLEKEQVIKECDGIKKENEDLMRTMFEMQKKLLLKDVEIENGKELLQKLTEKDKKLKGYEDKFLSLINKKDQLEEENCKLKEELGKKNEELIRRKEVEEGLFEHLSSQRKDAVKMEEKLHCKESESKRLEFKVEELEGSLERLNANIGRKTIELEECRKLLEQSEQQNDKNICELGRKDQLLSAHEKEKKLLLSRLNDLENKIEELQERLDGRNAVVREGKEDYKHLMQQFESKASELLSERQKRRELIDSLKNLKSQYNFLLARAGLTEENMQLRPKVEVVNEPRNHDDSETIQVKEEISPVCDPEEKTAHPHQTSVPVCQFSKVKKEASSGGSSNEEKSTKSSRTSTSGPPSTSNSPAASKWKTSRNTRSSTAAAKRPASNWRGAPRQGQHERDPHDDFLDTPLENIRGNLAKAVKAPVSNDMVPDSSDDETQDMNAEAALQRQRQQSTKRGPKAFKYVEPVRKKAQRENLKGVECKQCKKFYDAVLPDDQGKKGFRCEHLDGASRHRYRYAPPMTPEGFWNIGFDSEL